MFTTNILMLKHWQLDFTNNPQITDYSYIADVEVWCGSHYSVIHRQTLGHFYWNKQRRE